MSLGPCIVVHLFASLGLHCHPLLLPLHFLLLQPDHLAVVVHTTSIGRISDNTVQHMYT